MSDSVEQEPTQSAPEALASVRRVEERVSHLAGESRRWITRACVGFALLLGVIVFLLGAVFANNAAATLALIVPIPAVAGSLIFYARDRKPTLPRGVRKALSVAGVVTAILVMATAGLLALTDQRAAAFWIIWGLVVAAPFAVTGLRISRMTFGGSHEH